MKSMMTETEAAQVMAMFRHVFGWPAWMVRLLLELP